MPQSPTRSYTPRKSAKTGSRSLKAWKRQDAKAHFSQVVREAQQQGPQLVTLHGKDAVVVLSVRDYARLAPVAAQPSLHVLLSRSPLRDLGLRARERPFARARCRAVRGWLLDTNVVSELRELDCNAQVKAWSDGQHPAGLFLSRITIAEIRYGIERLPSREPSAIQEAVRSMANERAATLVLRPATRRGRRRISHLAPPGGERQGGAPYFS